MKLHRFVSNSIDLTAENLIGSHLSLQDAELVNQIKNVLRLEKGDKIILTDGKLREALSEIADVAGQSIVVNVLNISKNEKESKLHSILYCSILKRENFELVVQKATEVGIKEIVPIISKRTVKLNLRLDRLEKIAKEASEQSGRGITPTISAPISFDTALKSANKNKINLFFDEHGGEIPSSAISRLASDSQVGLFIGPEGGWDESEVETIKNMPEFKIVSLGKLTLRAETAAIVASYLISSL